MKYFKVNKITNVFAIKSVIKILKNKERNHRNILNNKLDKRYRLHSV